MLNKLIIIGAGGHGKVIADIALKMGYSDIAFADDNAQGECMGMPIAAKTDGLESLNDGKTDFVIGIGNNPVRKKIAESHKTLNYVRLVHPSAQIGAFAEIGKGTVVMAGAVINPCTRIGEHCIINTCAVIEHDNVLGDYVHISPNAALGGTVTVGAESHIGIGSSVKNNTDICEKCVVGAGAVIVKNITESGIYAGVPTVRIK